MSMQGRESVCSRECVCVGVCAEKRALVCGNEYVRASALASLINEGLTERRSNKWRPGKGR